VRYIRFLE